jgi:predicted porin
MKTRNVALGVSALLLASVAHAQSSVVLYGRLDAGLEYTNGNPVGSGPNGAATHESSQFRAESGDWGTSLWGLKGTEDLGNGYAAVFHLEGAFNTVNGQGPGDNELFDRYATVGIASQRFGTLLLGRELFISNGVWDFDPFGQSNWSSASLVRGRNWLHSSNNISFQTPNFNGFDAFGQYALSNATSFNGNGTTPQGRWDGLQLTYTAAHFQVRGIYDEIRDADNGLLDDPFTASREYVAMVNLFFGPFKIQGAYEAIRTSGDATAGTAPTTLDHEWGGVTWQISPAAALIAAVYHVNANKGQGNATLYSVGGSYNLSKRTMLDFQIATVQNSSTANFGLNANDAGDTAATDNPLPGHSQSGVYAGIQHSF